VLDRGFCTQRLATLNAFEDDHSSEHRSREDKRLAFPLFRAPPDPVRDRNPQIPERSVVLLDAKEDAGDTLAERMAITATFLPRLMGFDRRGCARTLLRRSTLRFLPKMVDARLARVELGRRPEAIA